MLLLLPRISVISLLPEKQELDEITVMAIVAGMPNLMLLSAIIQHAAIISLFGEKVEFFM
jgi:hypothetical protein